MKDLKNNGQSKGYGFVAFDTHDGALNALRKLVSAWTCNFWAERSNPNRTIFIMFFVDKHFRISGSIF
jgi:RNA recognition motif-containing protein